MPKSAIPVGSIVVGVDGSRDARHALEWAAHQADLEGRPLGLAHFASSRDVKDLMGSAIGLASEFAPGVPLHPVLRLADPREALLELAEDAAMVVVGSRGRGPVASLLLGSVSVAVASHAPCPVTVVRPRKVQPARRGVLVGLHSLEQSRPTIELGYRLASWRNLPLTVLHCFWDAGHPTGLVRSEDDGFDDELRLVSEATAGLGELFPEVAMRVGLARGFADREILTQSSDMDLVVVGAQRTARFGHAIYGSLAPTVVEHAECPVVVVPAP